MFTGPSFETPAEIVFARTIGADAAGMSTVPEAIIANHAGREIIGISLLSNMAAGVLDQPLSGAEVNEAGMQAKEVFAKVVDRMMGYLRNPELLETPPETVRFEEGHSYSLPTAKMIKAEQKKQKKK